MKLSIIIPVYNVEAYVEKCVHSCIAQKNVNPEDYEVIIVNDGTRDSSMEIVQNIINSVKIPIFINIINQENKGLSEARNTGLKFANGEYIWFIDSDDWIEDTGVADILDYLKWNDVDVLQLPYNIIYEDSFKKEIEHIKELPFPISGRECLRTVRFPNLAQSRIVKKSLFENYGIRFIPDILHEDAEIKPRLIYEAKSVMTLNTPYYNYLKRKNSITSSIKKRNVEGRWFGIKSMYKFSQKFDKEDRFILNDDMNFNMCWILAGMRILNKEERDEIINDIVKHRIIFKQLAHTKDIKKFLVYMALYICPELFISVFRNNAFLYARFVGKDVS